MATEAIQPNPWMILPFGGLLAAIALGPLLALEGWRKHYPKVAGALAVVTLAYYFFGLRAPQRVWPVAHEYVSFLALIGSLYVVSGGIHLRIQGEATPRANVAFLLLGGLAANVLGTTGASMLLIRPWLRMNKYRVTAHHVVFFIFIVANVGGGLTPIGDPPLFLGYLNGVPFWWVARHAWPAWVVGMAILLGMFYLVDRHNYLRAPLPVRAAIAGPPERWRLEGLFNLCFLAVLLAAVFVSHPVFLREGLMAGAAAGSWFTTNRRVHEANRFHWEPLKEVAILFAGIFATMIPALDWLQANAGSLGRPTAGSFYWGCGLLSSVLDNAPTYLAFLSAALGSRAGSGASLSPALVTSPAGPAPGALLVTDSASAAVLLAISISAVFFGGCTYLGNGPNFLIKSIADHQKAPTPTFLGYIGKFAVPFLVPMLVLVWLLFF